MRFNHINLVVWDPAASAQFYATYLIEDPSIEWLGESLHLRGRGAIDFAFQKGTPRCAVGSHHGFLAESARQIDDLLERLGHDAVSISDDCTEEGFRSIKFLDPDRYEVEVYWERTWP